MKTVRNIVAAVAAGSALSLGAAAFAQDSKQPEPAKPEAKAQEHRHQGMRGMHRMGQQRGMGQGCHQEEGAKAEEHKHG